MRSPRARALLVTILAGSTLSLIGASGASAAVTSGGGPLLLGPPTTLLFKPIGQNFATTQQGTLSLSGTIDGAGTIIVDEVIHLTPGMSTLHATWSCACTVNGVAGTLDGSFQGKDYNEQGFAGTFTTKGSGALLGFHSQGTFGGTDFTGVGSYSINYGG